MATAYLGLGSNLGDKKQNITLAAGLLAERAGEILALSNLYESAPWGFQSANPFLNAAATLRTTLTPLELLDATQQIERQLGRTGKTLGGAYHDRPIDIDLLLYDDQVITTTAPPALTLPHPLLHKRPFVLIPLAEIAPNALHPLLHKTIDELCAALPPAPSDKSDGKR